MAYFFLEAGEGRAVHPVKLQQIEKFLFGPVKADPLKTENAMQWARYYGRRVSQNEKRLPEGRRYVATGASNRTRTDDPRFTRAVLYQLSYAGKPWASTLMLPSANDTWK